MSTFAYRSTLLCVCLTLCHALVQGFPTRHDEPDGLFQLTIVHVNDFHARFMQTGPESNTCRKGQEHECIGGLARVITATRRVLQQMPNSIFLNAGDNYQGTSWYNYFKWNATAHFLNKLPQHALTIGNHEFDDGVEGLVPFLQRVRAPVVVANLDVGQEPTMQGLYRNSTILRRGNRAIGVIGVILKTTDVLSQTGKLKFLDEVESVNAEAERLKARGVDIIVVLSHVGLRVDKIIAASCPAVDVVVGGHSHSFLYSGKPSSLITDEPVAEYPVVVKQRLTNRTVLIVQAAAFTRYLGNLTVWFDHLGEVAAWEGNPIRLDSSIEQDGDTLTELKVWADIVEAMENKLIGESRTFLDGRCQSGECNLANLVTDAMVHSYKSETENGESWTYAAIGCINAGAIRTSIPVGNVTIGDLKTTLPFEGLFNVVEIKGDDLLSALEECVTSSSEDDYFFNNGLLHWSGIKVVYNMSMPAWSRVIHLSVRCQACKEAKFEPLDRDKWYRIVVSSFVLRGGDGLTTIASKHRNLVIGSLDVNVLAEYVKAISPITYENDHRMLFLGHWIN